MPYANYNTKTQPKAKNQKPKAKSQSQKPKAKNQSQKPKAKTKSQKQKNKSKPTILAPKCYKKKHANQRCWLQNAENNKGNCPRLKNKQKQQKKLKNIPFL